MFWTHPSVNPDETLNWKYFIKIWMDQLKMVDGIFFGPCKNFIFSQFTKMNFIEKRMKMVVSQVLYRKAKIHKLSFIRPSWLMSLESVNPCFRRITDTFGSNWTIFQNRIWLGLLLWVLWQGKGCTDQVSIGPIYCESLTQNYFYPKADLIFKVEMDQKEDHFHVVLPTTPFSYTTDVSDG